MWGRFQPQWCARPKRGALVASCDGRSQPAPPAPCTHPPLSPPARAPTELSSLSGFPYAVLNAHVVYLVATGSRPADHDVDRNSPQPASIPASTPGPASRLDNLLEEALKGLRHTRPGRC